MLNSKGQGISVNVIIIAAIALLVLVILSIIFLGRMGTFGKEESNCLSKGGQCVSSGDDCPSGYSKYVIWSCPGEDQECCINVA